MNPKILILSLLLFLSSLEAIPLTLEEKVGQMLITFVRTEEANEVARKLIDEAHIGGIIYYNWANGLTHPEQIQRLSNGLQEMAQSTGLPLLIAIDQEGGPVARLREGFTPFPGNFFLGEIGNPDYIYRVAQSMGRELSAVGINMNLAPVVDVSTSAHSVLRHRTYGVSPMQTAYFAREAIQGYRSSGIIATLKHFPGYGDATIDPHLGLPFVNKSLEELEAVELYPFKALVNDADVIMSAHIVMPALDPHHCATLSSIILEELLRKTWGYCGVVISDSIVMQGLLDECGDLAEAAIQAILAGNDILIFGGKKLSQQETAEREMEEFLNVYKQIVNAVKSGRISLERINASVERILKLKSKFGLFNRLIPAKEHIDQCIKNEEHSNLIKEIERDAIHH